jgi:hydroxysqualene dehydroxylase
MTLAVVGGGWAGLSAAVAATRAGHAVTLFEMAHRWGGRARSHPDSSLDNGQHILIGAYRDTLALMAEVGLDANDVLLRRSLVLQHADGRGLALRPGPAALSFTAAVLRCRAWSWPDRLGLLWACGQWAAAGFKCQPDRTVADLCADLPEPVRDLLIDPLCVAALNTPAAEASATVFLRVLRDGLFGGRGACDLLLPKRPLQDLLPGPASQWLQAHGSQLVPGHRVAALEPHGEGWLVDGQGFDAVVLACPALEASRLAAPWNAEWAASAAALRFEPIITVYVRCPSARLVAPMVALAEDAESPAQFVFDHGQLHGRDGQFAFVISGAAPWSERGLPTTASAVLAQAARQLPASQWSAARAELITAVAERRATFRCTPALQRPEARIAPGLIAAGDYVSGPYPATLEGAVRSGRLAVDALGP